MAVALPIDLDGVAVVRHVVADLVARRVRTVRFVAYVLAAGAALFAARGELRVAAVGAVFAVAIWVVSTVVLSLVERRLRPGGIGSLPAAVRAEISAAVVKAGVPTGPFSGARFVWDFLRGRGPHRRIVDQAAVVAGRLSGGGGAVGR